ncbi:MAG: FeoB-associated Cys-rich membrane protein [Bacteroidia bacterium]
MNWQVITVGIIFIAAIFYVVKSMAKQAKGKGNCGGKDCGCAK